MPRKKPKIILENYLSKCCSAIIVNKKCMHCGAICKIYKLPNYEIKN